jgi:hypothetical protein
MKKARRRRSFYATALKFTLAAGIAVTIALFWFSRYIADYEAMQPKHVVSAVMDKYFSPHGYESWAMEAVGSYLSEFENLEDYRRYIRSIFETGAISSRSLQATFTGDHREYTVYSGVIPFAKFVVAKTTEKSKFGFAIWGIGRINPIPAAFATRVSVDAFVLKGSELLINGKPVERRFFVREGGPLDAAAHLPPHMTDLAYDMYTVGDLFYEPTVSATDRDGRTSVLAKDGDTYREELQYSPVPDDLQTLARDALLAYCRFSTNDGNLNTVGRFFDRYAPVWDDVLVLSSWLWVYPRHTGYDYQDLTIEDYYRYNDDAFSVRAHATQIIVRSGTESLTYPIDFTMYFVKQAGGAYLVYNLVSHV